MSQLHINVYVRTKSNSADRSKPEASDNVTFLFYDTAISTNLIDPLQHLNIKYTIKAKIISSTYVVSGLLCIKWLQNAEKKYTILM